MSSPNEPGYPRTGELPVAPTAPGGRPRTTADRPERGVAVRRRRPRFDPGSGGPASRAAGRQPQRQAPDVRRAAATSSGRSLPRRRRPNRTASSAADPARHRPRTGRRPRRAEPPRPSGRGLRQRAARLVRSDAALLKAKPAPERPASEPVSRPAAANASRSASEQGPCGRACRSGASTRGARSRFRGAVRRDVLRLDDRRRVPLPGARWHGRGAS